MKNSKIIQITKIRQWYMPVDAESYKILRDAGAPLIRIHENFMPTLGLLVKSKGIRAQRVDFNTEILEPAFDKLGQNWQKRDHRKVTITTSTMKFETSHASALEAAKPALEKIETSLRRFFSRWGYTASFELSESRGKIKLHVAYKYDSQRNPIIPLVEDPTSVPTIRLELGFVRISLQLMAKEVETNISIATGNVWHSMHTSRCLYSQVSDVRPMIAAMMRFVNADPDNADNKLTKNG